MLRTPSGAVPAPLGRKVVEEEEEEEKKRGTRCVLVPQGHRVHGLGITAKERGAKAVPPSSCSPPPNTRDPNLQPGRPLPPPTWWRNGRDWVRSVGTLTCAGGFDSMGDPLPTDRLWRQGLVWGGPDVTAERRAKFWVIHAYFTQDRIDHLVLPFLKRGGAGGMCAATHGEKACISLRTLQEYLTKVGPALGTTFAAVTATGHHVTVTAEVWYREKMGRYHRRGMDAVRRGPRSYVRGSDGVVYPTTLPQLTLLYECWTVGIIAYIIARRVTIRKWIREDKKRQCAAKKAAGGARVTTVRDTGLCMFVGSPIVPPLFVDVDQFECIVRPPAEGDECTAFLTVPDDWLEWGPEVVPGGAFMTLAQHAEATRRLAAARAHEVSKAAAQSARPTASAFLASVRAASGVGGARVRHKPRHVPNQKAVFRVRAGAAGGLSDSESDSDSDGDDNNENNNEDVEMGGGVDMGMGGGSGGGYARAQ